MSTFNLQSLEKLLHDFYNLTNIKTCLYDSDGNELCYYPTKLSSFCGILRKDEKTDSKCRECDKNAFAICRKTRSQYVYSCHAGLVECVSPIICDNQIIGFIMLGQIKNSSKSDSLNLNESLDDNTKKELYSAYKNLPSISNEKLRSAFHILDACASYELLKTIMHVHKNAIDSQIDKYIHDNLSKPISVSNLCTEFHLSRHEIYNICNEYFSNTPAEYIKKCRLTHACKLLSTTNLPINKIAIKCGIPDYNYFSKVFKSNYGTSPTKYKKSKDTKKTQ